MAKNAPKSGPKNVQSLLNCHPDGALPLPALRQGPAQPQFAPQPHLSQTPRLEGHELRQVCNIGGLRFRPFQIYIFVDGFISVRLIRLNSISLLAACATLHFRVEYEWL